MFDTKTLNRIIFVLAVTCGVLIALSVRARAAGQPAAVPADQRETVLDRKVHIEAETQEIPDVPPLCDALNVEKRRIDVGACQLYCETEGRGMPIVLINGGPGGTHHGFHPHFGRASAFAQVVYYDQRGCGRSDYKPGTGYTLGQAVDDLDKLRVALKIDRWVALGWSYGGALAQLYALKHPEHTGGVVLVGSTDDGWRLPLGPTRQYDYFSGEERKRIAEIFKDRALPGDKLVYNIHLNGDWKRQNFYRPTKEELARMARYEWKHDPVFRASIGQQLGELDFCGLFEGCPVPRLVVEGKHDLTWGLDKAEKFHACHPGSKLVVFERSAHGPFMDEPDKFFAVLREFIEALPREDTAAIAGWKKRVADREAQLAAEAAHVSDTATFRTQEPAPPEFDAWTFFWAHPRVPEGARIGYEVRSGRDDEYFRWGPQPASPGGNARSDFGKGQNDPSKLYGQPIVVKFWTSKGKIEFPAAMTLTFEFYKDGKMIKRVPGIRKDG